MNKTQSCLKISRTLAVSHETRTKKTPISSPNTAMYNTTLVLPCDPPECDFGKERSIRFWAGILREERIRY